MVRAHDPWGQYSFERMTYDTRPGAGKDVVYPLRSLCVRNRVWLDGSNRSKVSKFINGLDEWEPPANAMISDGWSLEETKMDWEWMSVDNLAVLDG